MLAERSVRASGSENEYSHWKIVMYANGSETELGSDAAGPFSIVYRY
jgi:hypothetical protein